MGVFYAEWGENFYNFTKRILQTMREYKIENTICCFNDIEINVNINSYANDLLTIHKLKNELKNTK